MKNKKKKLRLLKKILIVVLIIIFLISISLLVYFLTKKEINLSLNGSNKIVLNYDESLIDTGATACYGNELLDNCKDVSGSIKTSTNLIEGTIGNYKITYEIEIDGIKKTIERYVSVVDKEKPVITLESVNENTFCPGEIFIDPGYSAYDEYDKDLSDKVIVTKEDNYIVYTVTDSSGNTTIEKREASYKDLTSPSIKLKGNSTVYVYKGSTYYEPGYSTSDNCSSNLNDKVIVTGSIDTNTVGDYTLAYSVTDDSNNKTTVNRTIKVVEKVVNPSNEPSEKTIYLTFDDGPSPYTPALLDVLKKYNVKATFFVVCKSTSYDKYIVRAYNEGHSIGLHTCTHVWKTIYSSVDGFFNDLNIISDRVYNLIGIRSQIIRFPGGSSNTVSKKYSKGIMTSLSVEVETRGYKYFDWNIASGDTETTKTSQVIKNVTSKIKDKAYYVVLQHDIKKYSVEAVEAIIKDGISKGYTFAPLTINSPIVHATIAN